MVASAQLTTRAYAGLWDALRPATQKIYGRMLTDFFGFSGGHWADPLTGKCGYFLAFLEYLVDNSLFVANISNYRAGLRTMFIIHNLPFRDDIIQMFVTSLRIIDHLL